MDNQTRKLKHRYKKMSKQMQSKQLRLISTKRKLLIENSKYYNYGIVNWELGKLNIGGGKTSVHLIK